MSNIPDHGFTGYPIELERQAEIRDTATPFLVTYADFTPPAEVDPRGKVRHDRQGNMGSCQGFSLTNCGEYLRLIAERDTAFATEKQFSALFAYLESQRLDGLLGRDRGSTIAGGLKVAESIGFCPEAELTYSTPYPSNATRLVTDTMRQAAEPFRVQSHAWLSSYDEIFRYLASGAGAVHTGTLWNNSFYARSGVLESVNLLGGGGHATAWLGYSRRKDSSGRNYLWRLNSHNDDWTEIAPSVVDQLCRHRYTSIVGISDLTTPRPRPVDFTKESVLG